MTSKKPRAIQWLEEQTGASIEYEPEASPPRHLSVRLDGELATALDAMAAERGVTVSHLVRDLLADAVHLRMAVARLDGHALAERLAADVAEVRRRLVS